MKRLMREIKLIEQDNLDKPLTSTDHPFETSDWACAAYLHALGFRIVNSRASGRRVYFAFADLPDKSAKTVSLDFYSGHNTAKAVLDSYQVIRGLALDLLNGGGR